MKQYNNYKGSDFTFVVCAYKECPYLEQAVRCLVNQTVKTKILISTSTPNQYIQNIADKYGIEVRVNPDGGQIKDYNFAIQQADTELVMLAHQDEIIRKRFVECVLRKLNQAKDPIIAFTNYLEMHNDVVDAKPSPIVKIKRMILFPMYIRGICSTKAGKWLMQCLGNPITHPTVVCVKKKLPKVCFREEYKAAMDWDLWQRLSKQKGSFVYVKEVLLYHRMNEDNQTVQLYKTSNARYNEELKVFCRFWPKSIAKIIMKMYSRAERYY